jgi:predicted Rossmann-fold nucleotide-binding protein
LENKVIACLGGGDVERDNIYYKAMTAVGGLLAEKKYIVVTGGFGGIMEAAAKGAIEAGGKTIGYTMLDKGSNPYISTTVNCESLIHPMMFLDDENIEPAVKYTVQYGMRLGCLLSADGFIISAGGGPGTMAELMAIINLGSKVWKMAKRIAILNVDEAYFSYEWNARMLKELEKWGVFPRKVQKHFRIAATPKEAVDWVTWAD